MSDEIKQYVGQYLERELKMLVHEKVQVEEELRFRQLKWIVIFIGLIGLSSITTLLNFMIDQSVQTQTRKVNDDIKEALDYFNFVVASFTFGDQDRTASQAKAGALTGSLKKLKENSNKHTSSPEFKMVLYQLINSLNFMGQSSGIDQIFSLYREDIILTPYLVELLLRHYGLEIIAMEKIDESELRYKIFSELESAAPDAGFEWRALAYRILYESKKDKNVNAVEGYLKRSLSFEPVECMDFFRIILMNSRAVNWIKDGRPSPGEMHIQEVTINFLQKYNGTINELYNVARLDGWNVATSEGIDSSGAYRLATEIAYLREGATSADKDLVQ